jgi:hypothetical protein
MPLPSPPPGLGIRVARPRELGGLREIEVASEQLFAEVGIGPFSEDDESSTERAIVVFVTGDPPVGFASVEVVDGDAHLGQLSVLPSAARQGRGLPLSVPSVIGRPHRAMRP